MAMRSDFSQQHASGNGGVRPQRHPPQAWGAPRPNAWGDQRPPVNLSANSMQQQQHQQRLPATAGIGAGNTGAPQRPEMATQMVNPARSIGVVQPTMHPSSGETSNYRPIGISGTPVKTDSQPSQSNSSSREEQTVPTTDAFGRGVQSVIKTEGGDKVYGRIATMSNDGDVAVKHAGAAGERSDSLIGTPKNLVVRKEDYVSVVVPVTTGASVGTDTAQQRRPVGASNSLGGDTPMKTDSQLASQQGNNNRAANTVFTKDTKKWGKDEMFQIDIDHDVPQHLKKIVGDGSLGSDTFSTDDMFRMNRDKGFKMDEYRPEQYMMPVDTSHGDFKERMRHADRMMKEMEPNEAKHRREEEELDDSMYSDVFHEQTPQKQAGGANAGPAAATGISNNWRERPGGPVGVVPQAPPIDKVRHSIDLGVSRIQLEQQQHNKDGKINMSYQQHYTPQQSQQQHDRDYKNINANTGPRIDRRPYPNNNTSGTMNNNNMNKPPVYEYRNKNPSQIYSGSNNTSNYGGNRANLVSIQQHPELAPQVAGPARRENAWTAGGPASFHQRDSAPHQHGTTAAAQVQQHQPMLQSVSGTVSPQQHQLPQPQPRVILGIESNEKNKFSHVSMPHAQQQHEVLSPNSVVSPTVVHHVTQTTDRGQMPPPLLPMQPTSMPYGQSADQRKQALIMEQNQKRLQQQQQQQQPPAIGGTMPPVVQTTANNFISYSTGVQPPISSQDHHQTATAGSFPPLNTFQQQPYNNNVPPPRYDGVYTNTNYEKRHPGPQAVPPNYNLSNNNSNSYRVRNSEGSGTNNNNVRMAQQTQNFYSQNQQQQVFHQQQQLSRDLSPMHNEPKKVYPGRNDAAQRGVMLQQLQQQQQQHGVANKPNYQQQQSVSTSTSSAASIKSSNTSSPSSQSTTTSTRAGGDSALPPSSMTGSPVRNNTNMTSTESLSDVSSNASDVVTPSTFESKPAPVAEVTQWVIDAAEFVPSFAAAADTTTTATAASAAVASRTPSESVAAESSGAVSPPSVAGSATEKISATGNSSAKTNSSSNNNTPTRAPAVPAAVQPRTTASMSTSTSTSSSSSTPRTSPSQQQRNADAGRAAAVMADGRRGSTVSSSSNSVGTGNRTPQAYTTASPSRANVPPPLPAHNMSNFQHLHQHQQQQQQPHQRSASRSPGNTNNAVDTAHPHTAAMQHNPPYAHHGGQYHRNNNNNGNGRGQYHTTTSPGSGGQHQGRPNFHNARMSYPPAAPYQQQHHQQHSSGSGGNAGVAGAQVTPPVQQFMQSSPPAISYGGGQQQAFGFPMNSAQQQQQHINAVQHALQQLTMQPSPYAVQHPQYQPPQQQHVGAGGNEQQQYFLAYQAAPNAVPHVINYVNGGGNGSGNGGGGVIGYPQYAAGAPVAMAQYFALAQQQMLMQQAQQQQQAQQHMYNTGQQQVVSNQPQPSFMPQTRHIPPPPPPVQFQRPTAFTHHQPPLSLGGLAITGTPLHAAGQIPMHAMQQRPSGFPPQMQPVPVAPGNNGNGSGGNGNNSGNGGSPQYGGGGGAALASSSYPNN